MKICITGSSGRIGSAVAKQFKSNPELTVIGIDLHPGPHTTHVGDINDPVFLKSILIEVSAIVHCAAFHAPHVGTVSSEMFEKVNVGGTETLLNAAMQNNINRFVFTSTTSVYGSTTRPKNRAVWVTEDLAPYPEDIYDKTKLAAEELCAQAAESGINVITLRMSRCFPEPDPLMLFYRLYRGVSPEDVAEAHYLSVFSELKGYHVFNISSQPPFIEEDCETLFTDPWQLIDKKFPGARELYLRNGWEFLQPIDRVYVIDKARSLLGYAPKENFSELLELYIAN